MGSGHRVPFRLLRASGMNISLLRAPESRASQPGGRVLCSRRLSVDEAGRREKASILPVEKDIGCLITIEDPQALGF